MIQTQTKLIAADNSGARFLRCIKVLKGFKNTYGYSGDIVLVSIRKLRLVRKVQVGEMYFGVIIRTSKESIYKDGSYSSFKSNALVLLNKKKRILSTRIFGPISKVLRRKKLMRLILMAAYNII